MLLYWSRVKDSPVAIMARHSFFEMLPIVPEYRSVVAVAGEVKMVQSTNESALVTLRLTQ
jgi:hypothetical protein